MLGLFRVLLATLRAVFRSRRELVLENAVLRHQLEVCLRTRPKQRLTAADRLALVWLSRVWPNGWHRHLRIVKPETVIGWHRKGWRLYWTWRSRARIGRPRLAAEVRELIAEMAEANPLWGTERIRGELLKLAIVVGNRSIRRYRTRPRSPTGSQRWRTFLTNELRGIWAADFFVVQTLNMRTLYVFVLIAHDRRELMRVAVTDSPTAAWIWQQFVEATPWGLQPTHLIHDRDAVYGKVFPAQLERVGVRSVRTPFRAPRANAVAERAIGRCGRSVLTMSSCSTSGTCARSSPSSWCTTTTIDPIARLTWTRRGKWIGSNRARSCASPSWADYITPMPGPRKSV